MGFIREQIVKRFTRSPKWSSVRAKHLKEHPFCAVCGSKNSLEVHHIEPFQEKPELELEPTNLITLCDGTLKCHLLVGHSGDFKCCNRTVLFDAGYWFQKIKSRVRL